MASLKSLFDRLPGLRSADDFSVIIPELKNRLDVVEAEADDLKKELEDALFVSTDAQAEVTAKIDANRQEQEKLRLAITGAEARRQEAARAEAAAQLEERMAQAKKLQAKQRDDYIEIHKHLSAVATLAKSILDSEKELAESNRLALVAGRRDLYVTNAWTLVSQLFGHQGHVEEHLSNLRINGYFPTRHKEGPALARMKEVKL